MMREKSTMLNWDN